MSKETAKELIDKFRNKPNFNLGEKIYCSTLFRNSNRSAIYEDEEFTEKYTNWSNNFEPVPCKDDGDHLNFKCGTCDEDVDVFQTELFGNKEEPQLRFHLYCHECNMVGTNKIYLRPE